MDCSDSAAMHLDRACSLPRLPYHLHEHRSRLLRISHFTQEIDSNSFHSFVRLEAKEEAQAIDGSHGCFGSL